VRTKLNVDNLDPFKYLYVGVDVHRFEHTAYASNRFEDELGYFNFANNHKEIKQFINWVRQLSRHESQSGIFIGLEDSGGNGALITNCLLDNNTIINDNSIVMEVNPVLTKTRRYHQTVPEKSDKEDARMITIELIRNYKKLPVLTGKHFAPVWRELKEIVLNHDNLVDERSRLKNRLHWNYSRMEPDYKKKGRNTFTRANLKWWLERIKKEKTYRRVIVKDHINRLNELEELIKKSKKKLKKTMDFIQTPLTAMPGIDTVNAAKIHAEVGDINRFKKQASFRRYAATAPVKHQSAGKGKSKPNKCGNRKLNCAIHHVALTQCWAVPESKAYYQKKISEGKSKKQALRCLKNRLTDIIYGVMKSGKPYED
jgi:transposase